MLLTLFIGFVIGIICSTRIKRTMFRLLDYVFTLPTRRKFNSVVENNYYGNDVKDDPFKDKDV